MSDPPRSPDARRADGAGTDAPAGLPRWVKVVVVVGVIVVAVFIVLKLVGGGDHGPSRHLGGDASSGLAAVHALLPSRG